MLADEQLYRFTGGHPPALVELQARYRLWATGHSPDGSEEWLNWIVRLAHDGRAIGTLQATIAGDGGRADIAWVIGLPWQGHGYASEAARSLAAALTERGIKTLTAHIHPDHQSSAAVARRAGLRPTNALEDGEIVWRSPPAPKPTEAD